MAKELEIIGSSSASEVVIGEKVTISGAAEGGKGTYTYSYLVWNTTANTWTRLTSSFGSSSSYTWTANEAGNYKFYVEVKDEEGTTVRSSEVEVKVVKKLSITGKSSVSEATIGEKVKITGTAEGGKGTYTYSYLVWNTTTNTWTRLTNSFGKSNSYEWAAEQVGEYKFYVEVKDETGTTVRSSEIVVKVTENVAKELEIIGSSSASEVVIGEKVTVSEVGVK